MLHVRVCMCMCMHTFGCAVHLNSPMSSVPFNHAQVSSQTTSAPAPAVCNGVTEDVKCASLVATLNGTCTRSGVELVVSLPEGTPARPLVEACPASCNTCDPTTTATTLQTTVVPTTTGIDICEGGFLFHYQLPIPKKKGRAGARQKYVVGKFATRDVDTDRACAFECLREPFCTAGFAFNTDIPDPTKTVSQCFIRFLQMQHRCHLRGVLGTWHACCTLANVICVLGLGLTVRTASISSVTAISNTQALCR